MVIAMFLILACIIALPILLVYAIRHRKAKKRFWCSLSAMLVLLAIVIWYLVPTRIPFRYDYSSNTAIRYDSSHVNLDEQQQTELFQLLDSLRVRRRFFNASSLEHWSADSYVSIMLYNAEGSHLQLDLDIDDPGHCLLENGSSILNPEALIEYLEALRPSA